LNAVLLEIVQIPRHYLCIRPELLHSLHIAKNVLLLQFSLIQVLNSFDSPRVFESNLLSHPLSADDTERFTKPSDKFVKENFISKIIIYFSNG